MYFDLAKVIMIYSKEDSQHPAPGPGTGSTVPDFPVVV
jgi:hypothetical protein